MAAQTAAAYGRKLSRDQATALFPTLPVLTYDK
jgi:hypothetical protein